MKNLIKRSTVLILLLLTVAVSGKSNEDDFRISTLTRNTINLQLSNSDGKSEIKIYDEAGILLHVEEILGGIFSKRFDLNLLPDGNYKIEVIGQTRISSIPLKIENATIEVFENKKTIVYKPIILVDGNIVYISRFSEQAENLSMTLFENDSKLYESKSLTGGSFGKTLDIKNLPFGDYKLVINYGDNRSLETTIKK